MSARIAFRFAWSIWLLCIGMALLIFVFHVLNADVTSPNRTDEADLGPFLLFATLAIVTLGALLSSRHPHNPIGWLFCAEGFALTFGNFAGVYAVQALLAQPGSLPGGEVAAWLSSWGQGPVLIGPFVLVFLLFPNGRLLSPRWRIVLWPAILSTLALNSLAFKPGPLNGFEALDNPFGVGEPAASALKGLGNIAFAAMLLTLLASAFSLVVRLRRARGEERQQMKWLVSAAAFMAFAFLIAPVIWFTPVFSGTLVWPVLFLIAIVSIPISIGIAILKYRLYAIDIIIRRTLIYGALTVSLAFVYFGSVVLLQQLFRAVAGQSSELAIIVSTLAIAALFAPLRRRVQNIIDRRFYRRKYDAQKVLAEFAATARDEVDLHQLSERLLDVVDETMQPAHVSLWLKPAVDNGRTTAAGKGSMA